MPPGWEFERAAGIVVWTGDPPPSDRSSSLGIAGGRRTRPFMEQPRAGPPTVRVQTTLLLGPPCRGRPHRDRRLTPNPSSICQGEAAPRATRSPGQVKGNPSWVPASNARRNNNALPPAIARKKSENFAFFGWNHRGLRGVRHYVGA